MKKIILASQSPRRKMLLEWAEIAFTIIVKETDESYPAGMQVEEVPVYIARNKALALEDRSGDELIIAADTVVVLGEEIIGKPRDINEAKEILMKLSGKTHRVITGVVILGGKKEIAFADITEVDFHLLTEEQITFYIEKYKPFDKAGAYAIQEWIGVVGIKRINGDFYNVMGLPVSRVVKALQEFD
jgi:septum formation protein